jgi:hypothetical protein
MITRTSNKNSFIKILSVFSNFAKLLLRCPANQNRSNLNAKGMTASDKMDDFDLPTLLVSFQPGIPSTNLDHVLMNRTLRKP